MRKLYIDFDNTIVDSTKKIVELYNEDYSYHKNFHPVNHLDINTWKFEELTLADDVIKYFDQPRFFKNLEWMDNAEEVLKRLSRRYEIIVVSEGTFANLVGKNLWLMKNMPYAKFRPVITDLRETKALVDMSDGYFFDDRLVNLQNNNAYKSICFGDYYSWNECWQGERCANWCDVERFLKKEGEKDVQNQI